MLPTILSPRTVEAQQVDIIEANLISAELIRPTTHDQTISSDVIVRLELGSGSTTPQAVANRVFEASATAATTVAVSDTATVATPSVSTLYHVNCDNSAVNINIRGPFEPELTPNTGIGTPRSSQSAQSNPTNSSTSVLSPPSNISSPLSV